MNPTRFAKVLLLGAIGVILAWFAVSRVQPWRERIRQRQAELEHRDAGTPAPAGGR